MGGAIKDDFSRVIMKCLNKMDSIAHWSVLEERLFDIYDRKSIFMHDGAPCHTSRFRANYLDRKHVCLISDWHPQSLDLNIIGHLLAILKRNVSKRHPNNATDLLNIVKEEWLSIPNEMIANFYASISKRPDNVISMKGHSSKY